MLKPKVLVVYGLGIGCHQETAFAYKQAGADVDLIHFNQLNEQPEVLDNIQILNIAGGFMHGDVLGSAMCACNRMARSGLLDSLWSFAEKDRVVYGQCNGFQLLVKSGLLPASNGDYNTQVATLASNGIGKYRVDYVPHKLANRHFAFSGLEEEIIYLWCRHGEGRLLVKESENLADSSILLQYVKPDLAEPTEEFPYNPNGSKQGIAGLQSPNGKIFGHMAHPEVSVLDRTSPAWFAEKSNNKGTEPVGRKIFANIVGQFA